MPDEMTKASLLDLLRAERSRWETLLAEVGDARMTTPILASWWSVKDIMTHITWYKQQTAEALQADTRQHPARDWLWDLTADKRNAILYTEYRDQPLADVRTEAQRVFAQLVATVEALSEEEIRSPHSFPDMPPGWQVWHFIARHSYEHYQHHQPRIRAWLDSLELEAAPVGARADAAGGSWATTAVVAL